MPKDPARIEGIRPLPNTLYLDTVAPTPELRGLLLLLSSTAGDELGLTT